MKLWDEGINTIYGGKWRGRARDERLKKIIAIVQCGFEH